MYSNPSMDYPYHTPSFPYYSTIDTTTTTPSFPSFPWELFTPCYIHGSSSPKLYLNHGYSPHPPHLNPYSSSPYSYPPHLNPYSSSPSSYDYNNYHQQLQLTNSSSTLFHEYQIHPKNRRAFDKFLHVTHSSFKKKKQKQHKQMTISLHSRELAFKISTRPGFSFRSSSGSSAPASSDPSFFGSFKKNSQLKTSTKHYSTKAPKLLEPPPTPAPSSLSPNSVSGSPLYNENREFKPRQLQQGDTVDEQSSTMGGEIYDFPQHSNSPIIRDLNFSVPEEDDDESSFQHYADIDFESPPKPPQQNSQSCTSLSRVHSPMALQMEILNRTRSLLTESKSTNNTTKPLFTLSFKNPISDIIISHKNQTSPQNNSVFIDDDKPREECGVVGIYADSEASRLCYLALHALQHRDQEGAEIVNVNNSILQSITRVGLVFDVVNESKLDQLPESLAIGHAHYSTTEQSMLKNVQPFVVGYRFGSAGVRSLKKNGKPCKPDASLFNHYLKANLIMGAFAADLLDLLAQMEHFDVLPNTVSFNLVLKAMHQVGEMLAVEKLLKQMLQSGNEVVLDDKSYDLVIGMLFSTDQIDAAFKYIYFTLKHGRTYNSELLGATWAILDWSLCKEKVLANFLLQKAYNSLNFKDLKLEIPKLFIGGLIHGFGNLKATTENLSIPSSSTLGCPISAATSSYATLQALVSGYPKKSHVNFLNECRILTRISFVNMYREANYYWLCLPIDGAWDLSPEEMKTLVLPPQSLLCLLDKGIPRVIDPTLYIRLLYNIIAWHEEDHYLYDTNYYHSGGNKTWYGIPS